MAFAALVSPQSSGWSYRERTDPIYDTVTATAEVRGPQGSRLSVSCEQPGTGSVYVWFSPDLYLGRGHEKFVAVRFDDAAPLDEERWTFAGDQAALVNNVWTVTGPMMAAGQVVVRAIADDGQQVTRAFSLRGSAATIERVYRTCRDRWPLPGGSIGG
ncbi:MAG: hypothetical protein ACT6TH_15405 [Brevundimonas sp.]|uniref:hypothetical protein n=1 Tax=Brevundimonas sp. TaxID=1871086 RepID=UPI0040340EF9